MLSYRRDGRGRSDQSRWFSGVKHAAVVLSCLAVGQVASAQQGWRPTNLRTAKQPLRVAQYETSSSPTETIVNPGEMSCPVPQGGGMGGESPGIGYGGSEAPPPSANLTQPIPFPQTRASLYPRPVQNTPSWQGGAVITNQVFAPHELLYPHQYHAMYGPFYYQVHGGWLWTPFGMKQHENWKLQGTEVTVKYRSHYGLFSGFHPPISH